MKPIIDGVDYLISRGLFVSFQSAAWWSGYSVNVYSGNLDLICDTPGTMDWINRLQWSGLKHFNSLPRRNIRVSNSLLWYFLMSKVDGTTVAFLTHYQNFKLYNVQPVSSLSISLTWRSWTQATWFHSIRLQQQWQCWKRSFIRNSKKIHFISDSSSDVLEWKSYSSTVTSATYGLHFSRYFKTCTQRRKIGGDKDYRNV